MSRASFYVIILGTLNRVPLMLPILSLPGPAPSEPEPLYPNGPPSDSFENEQWNPEQPWNPDDPSRSLAESVEDILYTPAGACPVTPLWEISAGRHADVVTPPEATLEPYVAKGLVSADGTLALDYTAIDNGGSMCLEQSNPDSHIMLGGMFFWEGVDGSCVLPPRTTAGNPCCMVYMWQTNTEGMFYGDCSMKMAIQPDGLYYFNTVLPGSHVASGWGEDPAPHVSYDIVCRDCAANDAFTSGSYDWWGKVYPEELCALPEVCGSPGASHQVQEKSAFNGKLLYKYDFVLPQVQEPEPAEPTEPAEPAA